MIVKENQPRLRADIELVFTLPPVGDRQATARTVDLGHGRIEQRNITTSEALVGYSDWPGLAQVFELGRHVMFQKTGEERVEVVYGVTSLRPERATPERLLALVRGQWQIETSRIGCAMSRSMKTAHRCAVATFPKSWQRYATPRLVCSGAQANEHCGGVPSVGCPAVTSVGSHRD